MTEAADEISHGFLIVKTFEALYRDFASDSKFNRLIYALPLAGSGPERLAVRYHGLDRNAVSAYDKGSLAQVRLHEIQQAGGTAPDEDLVLTLEDAEDVLQWAKEESAGTYELVWTRIASTASAPPRGFRLLGFEPTYFVGDHFSASCDCMCFPRWHGTDEEGTLFRRWFDLLNDDGLFATAKDAAEFLAYYLSFDWTETGDYEIAEVWGR